jgi:hypothetical protein
MTLLPANGDVLVVGSIKDQTPNFTSCCERLMVLMPAIVNSSVFNGAEETITEAVPFLVFLILWKNTLLDILFNNYFFSLSAYRGGKLSKNSWGVKY